MGSLQIIHKGSKISRLIPHKVYLNGSFVGILKAESVNIQGLPSGIYNLKIESMLPFFYSELVVTVADHLSIVTFKDREQFWDFLFAIDIILIILQWFITLDSTTEMWYKIFTNGYFVLWILYEFIIHKNYFLIKQLQ